MSLLSTIASLQAVFNAYRSCQPYGLDMNAPVVVPNAQPPMVITEFAERLCALSNFTEPSLFQMPVLEEKSALIKVAENKPSRRLLASPAVQHIKSNSVSNQSDDATDSPNLVSLTINSAPQSVNMSKVSTGSLSLADGMFSVQNGGSHLPSAPKCFICGAESTGIHFGVEACAACSAFFRRTVVLQKNYVCPKKNSCTFNHDSPTGQKCRACRFRKCINVGMDRNAVQQRRDAIGKFSQAVKREYTELVCDEPTPDSVKNSTESKSPSDRISPSPGVFDELKTRYTKLKNQRKLFYCNTSVTDLFESEDLAFRELQDFGDCMFQLYRVEPRLCVDFVNRNWYLASLSPFEKRKIFAHFLCHFQAVEEPYLTWQFGGVHKERYWVMPNKVYIDLACVESYFDRNSAVMNALNLDKITAENLFKPSFAQAMELIGKRMANLNITQDELIFLIGLVMFDPTIQGISEATHQKLYAARNLLIREMMTAYENDGVIDPEIRLANVILIVSGIKVHALKTRENMVMLNTFNIIPRDELFKEFWDIDIPDCGNEPQSKQFRMDSSPLSVWSSENTSTSSSRFE